MKRKMLIEKFARELKTLAPEVRGAMMNMGPLGVKIWRSMGTVMMSAIMLYTAPNTGHSGWTLREVRRKNSPSIRALRERIHRDIAGDDMWGDLPVAKAHRVKGKVFPVRSKIMNRSNKLGAFGMVVPVKSVKGIEYQDPENILSRSNTRFVEGRGSNRRRLARGKPHLVFVRRSALKAAIKKRQKMAGYLLSGWSRGSAYFRNGSAESGFHPELGGPGGINVRRERVWGIPDVKLIATVFNAVEFVGRVNRVGRDVMENKRWQETCLIMWRNHAKAMNKALRKMRFWGEMMV